MESVKPGDWRPELASLQNAFSNLRDNLEEEIDNHRESQSFIKLLENKLGETEAKFITKSKKFKAEKEALDNTIKFWKNQTEHLK